MSFRVDIIKALTAAVAKLVNPDAKHNQGKSLGEAFMWGVIADYAAKQEEAAWKRLVNEDIVPDKEAMSLEGAGDYEKAHSPRFTVKVKVSAPVRRFNPEALADAMRRSKFKVPVSFMAEQVEKAKKPTKAQVSYKIVEGEG